MYKKSFIFLALLTLGLVGCNKETTDANAPANTDQQTVAQDNAVAPAASTEAQPAK
jgi:hypothetical protein